MAELGGLGEQGPTRWDQGLAWAVLVLSVVVGIIQLVRL